jgi:hypothetical protein
MGEWKLKQHYGEASARRVEILHKKAVQLLIAIVGQGGETAKPTIDD